MGHRLLLVDDSASFLSAARDLLTADGFDVVGVAVDGAAGLDLVRRLRPEVVVLDVALPDVNGFEVAHRMTSLPAPPRVVLVSSRDWGDLGRRLRRCGAAGFLPKDLLDGPGLAAVLAGV